MEIRQMKYYKTIVEEGQITRAARALNMAQPPLSQQLKLLEKELGTTLIVRGAKQWQLTETGKVLYERILKILNYIEETTREIREVDEGIRGTLAIGTSSTCTSYLPKRIKKLQQRYPELYFKFLHGDTHYLENLLQKREIEAALLLLPVESKHLNIKHLQEESFVAVVPSGWEKQFERTTVKLRDLTAFPFLLLRRTRGKGTYETISAMFHQKGLSPHIISECPDIPTLLAFVASGIGISIMPRSEIHQVYNDQIKILSIEEPFLKTKPAVVWRKDQYLSKAASRFIETFGSEDR